MASMKKDDLEAIWAETLTVILFKSVAESLLAKITKHV